MAVPPKATHSVFAGLSSGSETRDWVSSKLDHSGQVFQATGQVGTTQGLEKALGFSSAPPPEKAHQKKASML